MYQVGLLAVNVHPLEVGSELIVSDTGLPDSVGKIHARLKEIGNQPLNESNIVRSPNPSTGRCRLLK